MVNSDILLKIQHVNQLGDSQEQVLLSEFKFSADRIVILDDVIMNSADEIKEIAEQSNRKNLEILIIPKIRGG
ncbi:MAG: hypothetical protein ACTSRG_11500 [Candidatus Helarchaeota archaeon]